MRFLEIAEIELDQAIHWYGAHAPGLGNVFLIEVLAAADRIARFPEAWRPLGEGVRRCRSARAAETRAGDPKRLDPGPWTTSADALAFRSSINRIIQRNPIVRLIDQGIALHQRGDLAGAESIYRKVLSTDARNFDALHMLGIVHAQRSNFEEAEKLLRAALAVDRSVGQCFHNYGNVLSKLNRHEAAIEMYDIAIRMDPANAPAYSDRGNAQKELGLREEAVLSHTRAVSLNPGFAAAYYNRGIALFELERFAESLASYERAIALVPDYPEAWSNRGDVLHGLKRYDEALGAYAKALALKADLANAWLGRGNVLYELKRHGEALGAYDKALALKTDLANASVGRGNALFALGRRDEALAAYDQALESRPDLAEAWLGRGNVLAALGQYSEAFAAYDRSLTIKPDLKYAEDGRLRAKLMLCDWTDWEAQVSHLLSAARDGRPAQPFIILSLPSSPADQLACARRFVADQFPPSHPGLWQGKIHSYDRIRVAYVSADLRNHAIAFLTAGLFEQHDKSRFEVTAISFGPEEDSDMRRRLESSFEHFVEARSLTDQEIAELVSRREIDIAVDLNGFTEGARTNIFARRPAPIQVNYLGYPGTMGADYFDYILVDHTIVPEDQCELYSEQCVWLPDSYQVNDSSRRISAHAPTRRQCDLPETGFVFCCFNNTYKITPQVFDIWMRILHATEGSILWLFRDQATAEANLRREAAARGIDPTRLVFAGKMPPEHHLTRYRLADLFLDTLPYNAHTTASDALWSGLPVLTCLGSTFAGRVAGSLLNAVGLPELIAPSLDRYESAALNIARDPNLLTFLKAKLSRNRDSCPLFDTRRFTRHIEAAYVTMWERYQRGEIPKSFSVKPIQ